MVQQRQAAAAGRAAASRDAAQQQHDGGSGGWRLTAADVRVADDVEPVWAIYDAESLPVHLPEQLEGRAMPLLSARAVERYACDAAPSGDGDGDDDADMAGSGEEEQGMEDEAAEAAAAADGGGNSTGGRRQPRRPRRRVEFAADTLLFAGAPVWCLDWCPWPRGRAAPPAPEAAAELLALSTHHKGIPRTRVGAALRGPGALQLWAVPHGAPSPAAAAEGGSSGGGGGENAAAALPRCLALLRHGGKLAWDVRWCPDPSALLAGGAAALAGGGGGSSGGRTEQGQQQQLELSGLLAAVLGDGSVHVYAVPSAAHLTAIAAQHAQRRQQQQPEGDGGEGSAAAAAAAAACPVLDLEPFAALRPDQMDGSLASCCRWWPAPPHDKLVVGCWDGHVAVWQLPVAGAAAGSGGGGGGDGGGGGGARLVMRIRAETCAVRSVAWQPEPPQHAPGDAAAADAAAAATAPAEEPAAVAAGAASAAPSALGGRLFATVSQWGDLRVWDPDDPFAPAFTRSHAAAPAAQCAWAADPAALLIASTDGALRAVYAAPAGVAALQRLHFRQVSTTFDGPEAAPLWGLALHPTQPAAAYCGDAGVLGLVAFEATTNRRQQRPAAAISALAVGGGAAWALAAAQLPGNAGLFQGGAGGGQGLSRGVLYDPLNALFCAAFSPNLVGDAGMLAAGGAAGLVRLHRLRVEVGGSGAPARVVE